jgi:hypothetical protein
MTDQEINKTIAEACGWKEVEPWLNGDRCFELNQSVCGYRIEDLPDYCNNLNAMHEAEKTVFGSSNMWVDFMEHLCDATGAVNTSMVDAMVIIIQATAKQRAEAFLRTVGKWEE